MIDPESIDLAAMIDHTALKPETTVDAIDRLCAEAAEYRFASVCVMPFWVARAADQLRRRSSPVAVATTVGFPLGAHHPLIKIEETRQAIEDGATEIDMVMTIGALLSGDTLAVEEDIAGVVEMAHSHQTLVKVIIETALLDAANKRLACTIATAAGADFVKTSTGFSGGGATVEDIRLMRDTVPSTVRIKASGGIRDRWMALAMIEAGASRIGTSSGITIIGGPNR
jgi:deoxyribose-phosphate aldolase